MAQKIVFNCKGKDDKGEPCRAKVIYTPEIITVVKMKREGRKPPEISASGEPDRVYRKCKNGHQEAYNVVQFKCQGKGCKEIVIATFEEAPVYEGIDKRVIDGKVELSCDNKKEKHTYVYEVVE